MNSSSILSIFLLALGAALSSTLLGIAAWLLLLPGFVEHGPAGPIEPAWLATTCLYGSLGLHSVAAGFIRARRVGFAVLSSSSLGSLIAVLMCAAWLGREWARGVPLEWDHLIESVPPTLTALSGSLIGGFLSARGPREIRQNLRGGRWL